MRVSCRAFDQRQHLGAPQVRGDRTHYLVHDHALRIHEEAFRCTVDAVVDGRVALLVDRHRRVGIAKLGEPLPRERIIILVIEPDDLDLAGLGDVEQYGMSKFAGELLAVEEFNDENALRKITPMNFLRPGRIFRRAKWIDHMFSLHVFDHPIRSTIRSASKPVVLTNPYL